MLRRFVTISLVFIAWVRIASAQAPPFNVVHPLPPQAPAWLEGYQVRWPVRVVISEPAAQESKSVLVSIPTGGWLKPDASDLTVLNGSGAMLPMVVLSHDPLGETVIQFKRSGNDHWCWVYGVNPKASVARVDPKSNAVFHEGVTLELREWTGNDLSSWTKVRAGLEKSPVVIGNAVVSEVIQNCNPARPDDPTHFAASYRGYLDIKKEGTYSFIVNADDASFLFIDGFKVFERPGSNTPFGTVKVKELAAIAGKVELKPGVHSFEVHQAVGNGSAGRCTLNWTTPEQPKYSLVPPTAIAHPLYARVGATERADGSAGGTFAHGIHDILEASGLKLVLVRFQAESSPTDDGAKVVWDFGDGTVGTGRSVYHIYFKDGDFTVSLTMNNGPAYKRRIRVWPEPIEISPLSLDLAVKTLAGMEWKKLDVGRIREIFFFLQVCEQPNRWTLLDEVAQHLLTFKDIDLEVRAQICNARMEALTQMGRAAEALKLAKQVKPDFSKTPALQVRVQLGAAAIYQYHYKDAAAASKIYKAIIDEHGRTEHPNLRLAAIRWGDLFAEAGDLARASETYRIAATLGGDKFSSTAQTDASTRGALLRIAEQKLKAGEHSATRQLLERIDMDYPGRRLDGLYCFLKAESDRISGRYESALRHYEMIFKLPQWAGYRDRATFGIADTYLRMRELPKALQWFTNLKEGYPKFHEAQKIAEVEKLLESRLKKLKNGKAEEAVFQGFSTGFEPEEKEWFGDVNTMAVVRAPSIEGRHALLLDVYPNAQSGPQHVYIRPVLNLIPGGIYWVEIWYRDLFKPNPPVGHPQPYVQTHLIAQTKEKETSLDNIHLRRNSHHEWHKLAVRLKAPMAQDFQFKIIFYNFTGAALFDAVSIYPVSDRQMDALTSFLEGR